MSGCRHGAIKRREVSRELFFCLLLSLLCSSSFAFVNGHCICVVVDRDGPEAVEFRSGGANIKDETGPAVCHDEVGANTPTMLC